MVKNLNLPAELDLDIAERDLMTYRNIPR